MIRRVSLAAALMAFCLTLFVGPATAATSTSTVGQTFTPTAECPNVFTALQTSVDSGNSYTVATSGTITSWSYQTGGDVIPFLKLKVGRPQSDGTYLFVGEAVAGTQTASGLNTYPADIPVQAGDVIGFHGAPGNGGPGSDRICGTATMKSNDTYAYFLGDQAINTAPSPDFPSEEGFRYPVSATVTTTTADQPPQTSSPSNAIQLGKPFLNKKKGTATEPVSVPGPGLLTLTGKGLVTQRPARASVSRAISAASIVNMLVKPKGKTKKKLNRTGTAKVKVTLTFTPTGGNPNAQTKTIKLKKKLAP